ncbi:MAG TPA: metallophosphoesterase [Longimicrobiales bacterium]|nr:metallophosphoesterase [Longimicrobiales bacterium]
METHSSDGARVVRIAAIGDIHFDAGTRGALRELFTEVNQEAHVLLLTGDLTTHGKPEQIRGFVEELAGVDIPVVTVLGNHDYEAGAEDEITRILCDAGVEVLDGTHTVVNGIGFAGTKGFAGGFGRGALGPFGEALIKNFVNEAVEEALKIEKAMRNLTTDTRIVVLHYAPIVDTVIGEPEMIYPFLGSSRMVQPIDTLGATAVFHGHAHHGTARGETPGGVPVYNVAWPLLRQAGAHFLLYEVAAPERRHDRGEVAVRQAAPGADRPAPQP